MSEMARIDQTIGAPSIIPGVSQTIAVGATSTASVPFQTHNALGRATTWIKVYSTVDCFLAFGKNPTADSTGCFHNGGLTDYYGLAPGVTEIAVIQASTAGTLYLTEGL